MSKLSVLRSQSVRALIVVVATLAGLAFVWLLLGPFTRLVGGQLVESIVDPIKRAEALNAIRASVLQALVGAAALGALVFTGRTYLLSREGQVTDRFAKAIGQLASDRTDERIGGVFSLERVMADSRRDHYTVVEVLSAFVREHAGTPADHVITNGNAPKETPADVQAALTVLGRRPLRPEHRPVNLIRTWLPRADLRDANFQGFVLCGANLQGADLIRTQLQGSHLDGADMTDTKGLTREQLNAAHGLDDPRTRLPLDLLPW
jgi:hypothetical protein